MQQQLNVDLSQTQPILCEECGHLQFQQSLILRRVSSLLTGTGQPGIVPIPVFSCTSCYHINKEFLPKEIEKLKDE